MIATKCRVSTQLYPAAASTILLPFAAGTTLLGEPVKGNRLPGVEWHLVNLSLELFTEVFPLADSCSQQNLPVCDKEPPVQAGGTLDRIRHYILANICFSQLGT